MKIFLTILLVPFLFCSSLRADDLSLAELIDIALKNNPETEKAWWNTKRANAALGIAKSTFYPTLDAQGRVDHAREVKFPNGPNTIFTSYAGELTLSYLLFDFGERNATVQATREALKAANWTSDFVIQKTMYKVAASYYEYLNAEELLRTKLSSLKDAEMIFDSAHDLNKAGLRSVNDLNTSSAAVAQIQTDLAQQRAQVAITYGKLVTTLGLPVDTVISVEKMPTEIKNPIFSEGIPSLIKIAEEKRADFLAQDAKVAEMNARVKRANRAPLPKLRALGQGGWLEYSKHKGSGYNYYGGVSLDVPIFKGFEYTYHKRLAYADAEMSLAELKELQEAIGLEVLTYSESVKAAQDALKWSEKYLEEAQKSYEASLECYKCGIVNIFDLLQTQRYLADARIKKTQAKTQWLVSLAELAFATGSM